MESDTFVKKIAHYQPSQGALGRIRQVPLLLAVGISGAGKDTILQHLMARYPEQYKFLVSHTTRKPRKNNGVLERDGVKYHFIDQVTAERMLDAGEFIEANYYSNNLYGASISEVEETGKQGKIVVSDIEVNGIANFMQLGMNAKPVFILPPSYKVWRQRLAQRYGEHADKADLRRRLQIALNELDQVLKHEYYYAVINDDLDQTVSLINDIAHGHRPEHRDPQALELVQHLSQDIKNELTS